MNNHPASQTVLIVDDQPSNIQVLAKLLTEEYRVLVANSGHKALTIARSDHPPDLILLDVQMPEMDGYELCKHLKSDPQTNKIGIIFITALDSVNDEEQGFQLGAVDYIAKPFHTAIVRARVRTHMELKRKSDLLEQIAMLDGLTGIPNRRHLNEQLDRERGRAQREQHPLSAVMLDIDHFKEYNDHYGHGAGDLCLQQVAKALAATLARASDLVARYGGEEFVALLPNTPLDGAQEVAENLRHAIEGLAIPHHYSSVAKTITISLGVATYDPTTNPNTTDNLLERADTALYRAKAMGRNRVVVQHYS